MDIPIEILLLLISLLASAFFSGFETGILSINRHRLLHYVRNGSTRAAYVARLLGNPHRLLATTLVGNNIVNVAVSTLAARLALELAGSKGQALAFPATTFLVLVFGEYLPKVWFTAHPLRRIVPMAPVFRVVELILYPIATACAFVTSRLAGQSDTRLPFASRENIKMLAQDSQVHGNISPFERLLISRVLDLQLQHAWQLMTPLEKIVHTTPGATLAHCRRLALRTRHSRIPVFETGSIPPVCVGVVQVADMRTRQAPPETPVSAVMRPPRFVDMEKPADDLLPFMRANYEGMLLLKDAGGHLKGLITQEDLLNALIEDLQDQEPSTDRTPAPPATGEDGAGEDDEKVAS